MWAFSSFYLPSALLYATKPCNGAIFCINSFLDQHHNIQVIEACAAQNAGMLRVPF